MKPRFRATCVGRRLHRKLLCFARCAQDDGPWRLRTHYSIYNDWTLATLFDNGRPARSFIWRLDGGQR